MSILEQLEACLNRRTKRGLRRRLHVSDPNWIDFCSNDYLGLAQNCRFHALVSAERENSGITMGSTGSRLLTGNHQYHECVEEELKDFYQTEATLLFNSGYMANLGVLSSVPQTHDMILYDAEIHNSTRTGIQLSRADSSSFHHNNVVSLEHLLIQHTCRTRNVFVVVESLYSMDGTQAPLKELVTLCQSYPRTYLIVDEAHSTGCYGHEHGAGLLEELGLAGQVFCSIHTFGKAMGCHGAVVCGSTTLKQYLINYARSLIYSTSLPFHSVAAIRVAHRLVATEGQSWRKQLKANIAYFTQQLKHKTYKVLPSKTAIQGIVVAGNEAVNFVAQELQQLGFYVLPIRSPTVDSGTERLRVVLHANHTKQEMDGLIQALDQLLLKRTTTSEASSAVMLRSRY